jgi:HAD superfamily hydrolase (TIGR01490 family)
VLDEWHREFMRVKILPIMRPRGRELIDSHRDDLCAIVTATNSFVTAPIARAFGIEHLIATEPAHVGGEFTGGVTGTPCFREGKLTQLERWLAARGQKLSSFAQSIFYSDSLNDLPLLKCVTHPVAVDPDDTLRAHAAKHGWRILSLA